MVVLGTGSDRYGTWKHLLPPGTAARWLWMVARALLLYGVTLRITPGWNAYRPLWVQKLYRAALGIMAAVPGWSSHGGWFNGRESMAIDVQNWKDLAPGNERLAWSRFVALCKEAGFTVDFVKPTELWHIGDLSGDVWTVPAGFDVKPLPKPTPKPKSELSEEDDMACVQSTHTKDWLVIDTVGIAPITRIPYGKPGSANQKRAAAYSKARGKRFVKMASADCLSLIADNGDRRVRFFRAQGLDKAIASVTTEIAELIAGEK